MPRSQQLTIQSLLTELEHFRLPVLCDLPKLQRLLKRESAAAKDIAVWVTRSPVFCLYAQQSAGEANKGRAGEVAGIEHALSMLGVSGIQKIATKVNASIEVPDTYLRQITSESLFALFISEELSKLRRVNANENMAAALFARASEWLIYWQAPRRAWQLRRMSYRKPFSGDQIGELLFGFRLSDLQFALAEKFVMPNLSHRMAKFALTGVLKESLHAIKQFREQRLLLEDCSRELRLHLGAPEMLPLVANKLAQASCSPWLRNSWGHWVDLTAIHCHCSTTEVVHLVINAYRRFVTSGVVDSEYPPVTALICEVSASPYQQFLADKEAAKKKAKQIQQSKAKLRNKTNINDETPASTPPQVEPQKNSQAETSEKPKVERTKGKASDSLESKPVEGESGKAKAVDRSASQNSYSRSQELAMRKLSQQLTAHPDSFKSLQSLVSITLQRLVDDTPIERIAFLMMGKEAINMKALMIKVRPDSKPLTLSKIELNTTLVLNKFMEKQTFLQFDKTKHAKYWGQFPVGISAEKDLQRFLVNSIYYKDKVRAFLYADTLSSSEEFSEVFLKDFKRMAAAFAGAMRHFTSKS